MKKKDDDLMNARAAIDRFTNAVSVVKMTHFWVFFGDELTIIQFVFPFLCNKLDNEEHTVWVGKARETRNGTQNLGNGGRAQGEYQIIWNQL